MVSKDIFLKEEPNNMKTGSVVVADQATDESLGSACNSKKKSFKRPTIERLGSVTALTTMAPATEGGTAPPPLPP